MRNITTRTVTTVLLAAAISATVSSSASDRVPASNSHSPNDNAKFATIIATQASNQSRTSGAVTDDSTKWNHSVVHVASTRDIDALTTRLDKQLRDLHRPVTGIRITRLPSGIDAPINRAAGLVDEPEHLVTALGFDDDCDSRSTTTICYQPLYFEQPNLERCSKHLGVLQNIVSLSQFTGRTLLIPYKMGRHLPTATVIAGQDCRSGQCYQCGESYRPAKTGRWKDRPSTARGLAAQAGALAGFTFLLL